MYEVHVIDVSILLLIGQVLFSAWFFKEALTGVDYL